MPIEWYEIVGATTAGAMMALNVGALVYRFVYHPMKKRKEAREGLPASDLEQNTIQYTPAEGQKILT
ncbi:MAG: hypothetical protein V1729_04240 [Candidatus Woesearchaeota archaeon]